MQVLRDTYTVLYPHWHSNEDKTCFLASNYTNIRPTNIRPLCHVTSMNIKVKSNQMGKIKRYRVLTLRSQAAWGQINTFKYDLI